MQIKIYREDDGYNFFKTKKAAEYAARKEKSREEAEEDTIIEI